MNKRSNSKAAFFNPRALTAFALCMFGLVISLIAAGVLPTSTTNPVKAPGKKIDKTQMVSGTSYKNDVSPPLREANLAPLALPQCEEKENPKTGRPHVNRPDGALQDPILSHMRLQAPNIPTTVLNFDSIA